MIFRLNSKIGLDHFPINNFSYYYYNTLLFGDEKKPPIMDGTGEKIKHVL